MSKTLSKTITSKFFATEGGYDEMRRRWKAAVNNKDTREGLTSSNHALYLILSGKNLQKAFTPITQKVKLDNGMTPHNGLRKALSGLQLYSSSDRKYIRNSKVWAMFDDLLSDDVEKLILEVIPSKRGEFDYNVPVQQVEVMA